MVDGSGLENRHTRKGIGGSNPSLSASLFNELHYTLTGRLIHHRAAPVQDAVVGSCRAALLSAS